METTGMTEGGQSDEHADLEMVRGSLEDPEIKDETESMEDERDPEVGACARLFTFVSVNLKSVIIIYSLCFYVSLIVWSNDSGDKIPESKNRCTCK